MNIHISNGREAVNDGAFRVMPGPMNMVVVDRGYDNSRLRRACDSMSTTFVARLRKDIHFKRLYEFLLPDDSAQQIPVDEIIEQTGGRRPTKSPPAAQSRRI